MLRVLGNPYAAGGVLMRLDRGFARTLNAALRSRTALKVQAYRVDKCLRQADEIAEKWESMSDFAQALKPHLEAHGIEDAQELTIRLRVLGSGVPEEQVERWLSDEPVRVAFEHLVYLEYALGLDDAESDELYWAARRDSRLGTVRRLEEKRRFNEIVEGFQEDSG
jgi:hypothetical protein